MIYEYSPSIVVQDLFQKFSKETYFLAIIEYVLASVCALIYTLLQNPLIVTLSTQILFRYYYKSYASVIYVICNSLIYWRPKYL